VFLLFWEKVINKRRNIVITEWKIMETIVDVQDGKSRILTEGSFVTFFETEDHQYTNQSRQGFIENIDEDSSEASIRMISGKVLHNVCLFRVYL
jgi:cell shape-determining protein MreC